MTLYLVRWEIKIDADSPRRATTKPDLTRQWTCLFHPIVMIRMDAPPVAVEINTTRKGERTK